MYKLKKLELLGFKSFADRSRLEFADGIAAVVGPNGCGKSNLSDAITWVLGEQSARLLRGERMADVIFNGTGTRPPTGMAEVSMTLVNPEYNEAGVPEEAESIQESEPAAEEPAGFEPETSRKRQWAWQRQREWQRRQAEQISPPFRRNHCDAPAFPLG